MKPEKSEISVLTTSSILSLLLATTSSASAQIIPDNTLPNNTIVAPNGQTINIEEGTRSGGNLFHSFQEFNLGTGTTAFFNNAADIQNILSRVTGGKISNIDGLIRANGAANLFLVNPAGIVFGPNARLNIGGSFLASTADRVIFNNGSFFSATEPNAPPLLTVNVPIGLQMGGNPGAIIVRGPGHNITSATDFAPTNRVAVPLSDPGAIPSEGFPQLPDVSMLLPGQQGLPPEVANVDIFSQLQATGLFVRPGNTLGIVGGDVVLEGGILTALEGRMELGSVKQGSVSINPAFESMGDFSLGYEGVAQFGDILMKERSLLDASSLLGGAGSIQVQGQNLELRDVSLIGSVNFGSQPSGNILVNTVESITASGSQPNSLVRSGVFAATVGSGNAGDIDLSTSRLFLEDGGHIVTFTLGQETSTAGAGGNIDVRVVDAIEIIGISSVGSNLFSAISAETRGAGNAGNLTVSAGQLRIVDGGLISSNSSNSDPGGQVNINATDFVEIVGVEPNNFIPSTLSVFPIRGGTAGNLTVNTPRLIVKDGGRVGTTTSGSGNAGRVTINASESVEVTGVVPGSINPSIIDSSADILDESIQLLFGLPPVPTGDTGELTINTPRLRVADGAQIGVQHEGTGNAGALRINAGSVLVERGGSITAGSASGLGGNVVFNVRDSLLLRNNGSIAAEAGGTGDGGNLTINAQTITLLGNSSINANALEGIGGNIQITTEGLFPSADSAITASSQLGVDGTIEVEGIDSDPSVRLANLPANVLDATTLIASGCAEFSGGEYITTGRGGLPPAIDGDAIATIPTWRDWRRADTTNLGLSSVSAINIPEPPGNSQLVEATRWIRRSDGVIELVADSGEVRNSWYELPDCHSID